MNDRTQAVLRGAAVIDGTGAPARDVDVAIDGGRIVEVGKNLSYDCDEVDLSGLVLAPGFVDPHTHYDAQIFWDPDLTPSSWHGVTTVVTGNCGFTVAPTRPSHRDVIVRTLENVEGMPREALEAGIPWSFESFPEYVRDVDALGKRLNMACLIGHTALRWFVLGDDAPDREATRDEIDRMCELVRGALACGAVGFSTSQHTHVGAYGKPVPSRAASHEELARIAHVLGEMGTGTIEVVIGKTFGVEDAVELARSSGRPLTWSGDVLVPAAGENEGPAAMAAIDVSTSTGAAVFPQFACRPIVAKVTLLDPFPLRSSTEAFAEVLRTDPDRRLALYGDEAWRRRAKEGLTPAWARRLAHASVDETSVHTQLLNGPTLGELAARDGVEPLDVLVDLSLAEGLTTRFAVAVGNTDEDAVADLLADRRCLVGLGDAGAHVTQHCDANYPTHLLGYWVRERKALPLELAVWRLTAQPAMVFGLHDRGRIEVGLAADLVAFDADRVGSGEEERVWDFPGGAHRLVTPSTGVEWVWVNGTVVRQHGADVAGMRPGRRLTNDIQPRVR
jgi:N-acyl-D-aspartate/D-glutamate deacylase